MNPKKINRYQDLANLLQDPFIIFCGSGVSAFPIQSSNDTHLLPMVNDIIREIYNLISIRLKDIDYYNKVLAAYINLFLYGKHKGLYNNLKFEEFIYILEKVLGRDEARTFLQAAFLCEWNHFGYNHHAIIKLITNKRVCACITTNYDNGIENADRYFYPEEIPLSKIIKGKDAQEVINQMPCILKLHGDAVTGEFVATIPTLFQAAQLSEYAYLRSLLHGRTILVLGYSGDGDIDISPHLTYLASLDTATKFIWLVQKDKNPPQMATHWFTSDLGTSELRERDPEKNICNNWLIELSGLKDVNKTDYEGPNWKSNIQKWVDNIEINKLSQIVQQTYWGRYGWSYLHMFYLNQWGKNPTLHTKEVQHLIDTGIAYIQVAAYQSAETAFKSIHGTLTDNEIISINNWMGFIYWRVGKLDSALNYFKRILQFKNRCDKFQYIFGIRHYLEVSRDIIQYSNTIKKRIIKYNDLQIDYFLSELIQIKNNLGNEEPNELFLCELIQINIKLLMGEKVQSEEIIKIYNQLYDLKQWGVAEAAARLLIQVDFFTGLCYLKKIDLKLFSQKNFNTIRKSIATIFESIFLFKWMKPLYFLDGPAFTGIKYRWVEYRLSKKIEQWKIAYNKGETFCE